MQQSKYGCDDKFEEAAGPKSFKVCLRLFGSFGYKIPTLFAAVHTIMAMSGQDTSCHMMSYILHTSKFKLEPGTGLRI